MPRYPRHVAHHRQGVTLLSKVPADRGCNPSCYSTTAERSCTHHGGRELFATDRRPEPPRTRSEFDTIFVPWAFSKTKAEILESARQHKVYASPMLTTHDIFHDANFEARGFFREVDHPATGRHRYPGPPVKMDRIEWRVAPAPLLGEHNREILVQRLGYSLADLARLRQAGVI